MMSKEELFELTSDKVYEAILNGKISLEQFQEWITEDIVRNRRASYEQGYSDGMTEGHRAGYEDGYEDGAYYSAPQA
jgi:flagellar biosynthesis/type III secretory pathway protein FliH